MNKKNVIVMMVFGMMVTETAFAGACSQADFEVCQSHANGRRTVFCLTYEDENKKPMVECTYASKIKAGGTKSGNVGAISASKVSSGEETSKEVFRIKK